MNWRKGICGAAAAFLALIALPGAAAATGASPSCERLAGAIVLKAGSATDVTAVAPGAFVSPSGGMAMLARFSGMNLAGQVQAPPNPAFCRVRLTLRPSADSAIKVEVWLPLKGWNGKFLAAGNFGWAGAPMYVGMQPALSEGYATASTDTGHDSAVPDEKGGAFALGHPEKMIDYAYRADHEMTVVAKAIIRTFYGKGPSKSYWIGCSLGGLEGLIEAKRYPADYDGIVVGAPPNPLTNFNAAQLWPYYLVSQAPARIIPKEKYAVVHEAVLQACATPIGRKDGVVDRPYGCTFDPATLRCRGSDAPDCLTDAQVFLLTQIYAGPSNPRTGEVIFPGPARGTELELFGYANGRPFENALDLFRYVAFDDAAWTPASLDWDKDIARAVARVGPLLHVDADLRPFFARGGKLLLYVGWNDYHNPNELAVYYERLIRTAGPGTRAAVRLFAIPGMGHCFGGAGCDTFNKAGAIDNWVTTGKPPETLVASKVAEGKVVRSRPLCAWPLVSSYKGTGDPDNAASFGCTQE